MPDKEAIGNIIIKIELRNDIYGVVLDSDDPEAPPSQVVATTEDVDDAFLMAIHTLKKLRKSARNHLAMHSLSQSIFGAIAATKPHPES